MPVITVGLSYRTAPIEVRESVSITEAELPTVLQRIHALAGIEEVAILSTCNRLEVYAVVQDVEQGWRTVEASLRQHCTQDNRHLGAHLYAFAGLSAANHLMEVACGLDSLILGEPQILGQVSSTLNVAQEAGTIGPVLQRLFSGAIHSGKRARTETSISRYTTSISHAAVLLAAEHVPDLQAANVLVVGAGEMANLAVKTLYNHHVRNIGCINRTYTRASALVRTVEGKIFDWRHLDKALIWADVVITATGAPHTVIHSKDVAAILPNRQGRALAFVDIALPRDVEDGVEQLANIYRYDIDDLRATLDANLTQREAARPAVEAIIGQEMDSFTHWHDSRQAIPTLVEMRSKVQTIAQAELNKALAQLPELNEREEEIVRLMVHRLVNKVLHDPTVQLKAAVAASPEAGQAYIEAVRTLFDLLPPAIGEEAQPLERMVMAKAAPIHERTWTATAPLAAEMPSHQRNSLSYEALHLWNESES